MALRNYKGIQIFEASFRDRQLSMMDFNDTDSLRTYAKVDICSRIRIVE
jgi:hypothetical protein